MKFDVIVTNPPYNSPSNEDGSSAGGKGIWVDFIEMSDTLLNDDGHLLAIHPSQWRKPQWEYNTTKTVNKFLFSHNLIYLDIKSKEETHTIFNKGTKVDWYLLQKSVYDGSTVINDELGNTHTIDISNYTTLPNFNFDIFQKVFTPIPELNVIFGSSYHSNLKDIVSFTEGDGFIYPLIHSTPKSGIQYAYSNRNDKGHFGIPKIIFGESGIGHVVIDMNGVYGMTQCSMGIGVDTVDEAKKMKAVLTSNRFKHFLKSVSWSNFRIEANLFRYLRKDFWKFFI